MTSNRLQLAALLAAAPAAASGDDHVDASTGSKISCDSPNVTVVADCRSCQQRHPRHRG